MIAQSMHKLVAGMRCRVIQDSDGAATAFCRVRAQYQNGYAQVDLPNGAIRMIHTLDLAVQRMMVMPANSAYAHGLNARWHGRVGWLLSPGAFRDPRDVEIAVDNGAFVCWSKSAAWDEAAFVRHVEICLAHRPRWIVVPDVVADADATFARWHIWAQRLKEYGIPLALAVQDGMTAEMVRSLKPRPDVIFVGGSTSWKRRTLWAWCANFVRVHVARVNTERWLWECDRAGAESCDGTGWFRGDQSQRAGLLRYLDRSATGREQSQGMLFA